MQTTSEYLNLIAEVVHLIQSDKVRYMCHAIEIAAVDHPEFTVGSEIFKREINEAIDDKVTVGSFMSLMPEYNMLGGPDWPTRSEERAWRLKFLNDLYIRVASLHKY